MTIHKYPDGTAYVTLEDPTPITQQGDCYMSESEIAAHISGFYDTTFRINSYEDLWHLNQYVEAVNNIGVTPHITIPCLIDGQADRRFHPLQSSGLKLVLKFLNDMDAYFTVFHPHNASVVEAMLENVDIEDNTQFIISVLTSIDITNLILMSSDSGGFKPLMKLCEDIDWKGETFSASKARSWDEKEGTRFIQQIDRADFGGKDILIVDDCAVYGGTFKGLAKMLKERNCGKLYLAVSHMTVQDLGSDPVTDYFNTVFTTNSKYERYVGGEFVNTGGPIAQRVQPKNLKIINLF